VQVDVCGWHCLALSDKGQVYAWGGNEYNQVGRSWACHMVAWREVATTGVQADG